MGASLFQALSFFLKHGVRLPPIKAKVAVQSQIFHLQISSSLSPNREKPFREAVPVSRRNGFPFIPMSTLSCFPCLFHSQSATFESMLGLARNSGPVCASVLLIPFFEHARSVPTLALRI